MRILASITFIFQRLSSRADVHPFCLSGIKTTFLSCQPVFDIIQDGLKFTCFAICLDDLPTVVKLISSVYILGIEYLIIIHLLQSIAAGVLSTESGYNKLPYLFD